MEEEKYSLQIEEIVFNNNPDDYIKHTVSTELKEFMFKYNIKFLHANLFNNNK